MNSNLWISLGSNCEISFHLRRRQGDRPSLPLDWWITPIASLPGLITGGFQLEVSSKTLRRVGDGWTVIHEPTQILFHHEFERDENDRVKSTWESEIPAVAERVQRRISRLREVLKTPRICVLNRHGADLNAHSIELSNACHDPEVYDRIRMALGPKHHLVIFNPVGGALGITVTDHGDPISQGHFAGSMRGWDLAFDAAEADLPVWNAPRTPGRIRMLVQGFRQALGGLMRSSESAP